MMTFRKTALALAMTAIVAGVASVPAQATVMATALIDLTNFTILKSTNGTTSAGQLNATGASVNILNPNNSATGDLSFLTFTSTGAYNGTYPGTVGYNTASSAAPVNLPPVCVGPGCNPLLPDNSYPTLVAPPTNGYSAADQSESGAPVIGVPGFPSPAAVANESAVALTLDTGLATSNASNTLNSSFIFKPLNDLALEFSFNLSAYLQAAVTADEAFPSFADSSLSISFTIKDIGVTGRPTVFQYSPTILDTSGDVMTGIGINAPVLSDTEITQTSVLTSYLSGWSPILTAGHTYQLAAATGTLVNAQRVPFVPVPEPGILSLLGIGLLGLGGAKQLRRSRA